jgi:2-C-methyl-D-erythritol 2,4-cyclodiphosphate synthase
MIRVGQGFDLHRLVSDVPLRLGGVTVESPVGSEGHSDGDVILHALIDALLGAAGLGDIGEHFPPSDPQYKGINSLELLARVKPLLAPWTVVNADITVMLERPKLGSYKPVIRQTVADALGLEASCVSVKAKTMEGLGPIGQQEAVAAIVTVLLEQ